MVNVFHSILNSNELLPMGYSVYTPVNNLKKSAVIFFVHGFKGFKDWGGLPIVFNHIAQQGFTVIAINLSHNGIIEHRTTHENEELFATATLSQDHRDISSFIHALQLGTLPLPPNTNLETSSIGLIGHSRGGHSIIAYAASNPSIKAIVSWAAVADCSTRWSLQHLNLWDTQGFIPIINKRTGQTLKLYKNIYDDAQANPQLMAINAISLLNIPTLIIHGSNDESVSCSDAQKLYNTCAAKHKKLALIPNGSHTFGLYHPMNPNAILSIEFKKVLQETEIWMEKYLS